MSKPHNFVLLKMLLVGDSSVGKTSMMYQYVEKAFSNQFISTIGIDFKIKTIELDDGTKLKLQIW